MCFKACYSKDARQLLQTDENYGTHLITLSLYLWIGDCICDLWHYCDVESYFYVLPTILYIPDNYMYCKQFYVLLTSQ